jgi:hypothetical protein
MKNSLKNWLVLLATCVVVGGLLSACAWSIGDGKDHGTTTIQPTRGQELIDLKKAKDQGAITEDEYQAQRKSILAK